MNIFYNLGEDLISKVITKFYKSAFSDPIIGHFFLNKDQKHLIEKQTQFACVMLGSKEHKYLGEPLTTAHRNLIIKKRTLIADKSLCLKHYIILIYQKIFVNNG